MSEGSENERLTQVIEEQEEVHEAGIFGTAMNMFCNIMGGAVLVLPTAMNNASLIPGLVLIIGLGLISMTTMIMLVHSAEKLKVYTYRTLLAATTRPIVGRVFEVCLFLYTFGVLVEYGCVILDSMPDVAADFFHVDTGVLSHGWFWLLLACVPFAIFTALPRLTELKWTSIIGFATIVYIQIMIVVRYSDGTYRNGRSSLSAPDIEVASFSMRFFKAIPVLAVAFSCHYNVPFYYKELKVRTIPQFYKVLCCVHPMLITAYVISGLLGYLTFGSTELSSITGNVVNAYRNNDVPVNVGRLGLFFHFCTAFPIVAMGCRNCLNGILFNGPNRPQMNYIIESLVLVSLSAFLAIVVPGIAFVVEIIGSLFGVAIVFIIPSVVYVQSNRRFPDEAMLEARQEESSSARFQRGESIAVCAASSTNSQPPSTSHESFNESNNNRQEKPLTEKQDFCPPMSWTVRRNEALFILAHFYAVLGVAGAIISFVVTIQNVANGES